MLFKDAVLNTVYTLFFKEYPFYDDLEMHGKLQDAGIPNYYRILGEHRSDRLESHKSLSGRRTGRRSSRT